MSRIALLSAALLLTSLPAAAVDMEGADMTPANYDTLSGTYTNVGNFTVSAGVTVFVGQGSGLFVYASTVTIHGHLNANGRGEPGGYSGEPGFEGGQGFGPGKGGSGAAGLGGGGGGYGDADGDGVSGGAGGASGTGGSAGAHYNSTATLTIPFSANDIFLGSGGGGGGGGAADTTSGAGGSGGGLVYLEADYVVITGTVSANGLAGGTGIDASGGNPGGGGGGGSGGAIGVISRGVLYMPSGGIFADGGPGGAVLSGGGGEEPGGGGAGGRVTLVYNDFAAGSVTLSTSAAPGGQIGFFGGYAQSGSSGAVSMAILPSSPTGLAFTGVFLTSAAYTWDGMAEADFGGPLSMLPELTTMQFRLFAGTDDLPFTAAFTGVSVSSAAIAAEETGLTPDTTVYRFITAYTDLGDSAASPTVSTWTWAAPPVLAQDSAFVGLSSYSLSVAWSSGAAVTGFNPAYTSYELSFSSAEAFGAPVSTGFLTGVSSSPANLLANTTYYLRVRALGLNGAYTAFAQTVSTPTMAAPPYAPAFSQVHVSSAVLVWNGAGNPGGTVFEAQLSVDNFLTVSSAPLTTDTTAYFGGLSPGTVYTARVRALNRASVPTDFSLSVSTTPGSLSNLEAPGKPEPPQPASPYSYDGTAVFAWSPPAGSVPIFEYILELGTFPGGNDLGTDSVLASAPLNYSTNTLVSGKTYYGRVRAKSAAGVLGEFSSPGSGVQVWITANEAAIVKPYNWPNPFDPAAGATNIGFNLAGPATVTMRIFTLQGREVWSRSAYEPSAGNKVWTWNGRNGAGSTVEPGGYAVMVTKDYAGGGSQTQKFKLAVLY